MKALNNMLSKGILKQSKFLPFTPTKSNEAQEGDSPAARNLSEAIRRTCKRTGQEGDSLTLTSGLLSLLPSDAARAAVKFFSEVQKELDEIETASILEEQGI